MFFEGQEIIRWNWLKSIFMIWKVQFLTVFKINYMAINKNKGETVLNHKLFLEINILKIVKYLVKYIVLLF